MKKFLEPEILVINLDQETILMTSPGEPSTPTNGGGTTDFDLSNNLG